MSKAKLEAAREMIREKNYAAARAILETMPDNSTALKWLIRLDEIAPIRNASRRDNAAEARRNRRRQLRLWRNVWGVFFLFALGWVCYGLTVSSQAYTDVATGGISEAGKTGAAFGAGLGILGFICTALPFLLVFGWLYARNGSALRGEIQHDETLNVLKGGDE